MSTIHREVIGVVYLPARRSRFTYGGLERAELRVVPVTPTPPLTAGQSDSRGLGYAWRSVNRAVERP